MAAMAAWEPSPTGPTGPRAWSLASSGMALSVLALAAFHVSMTKNDLRSGLAKFMTWKAKTLSQRQIDQKQRFEQELLERQVYTFSIIQSLFMQICFGLVVVEAYKTVTWASSPAWVPPVSYLLHSAVQAGFLKVETHGHVLSLKVLQISASAMLLWQIASETDLDSLETWGSMLAWHLMICAIVSIDFTCTLPFNLAGSVVLCCRLATFPNVRSNSFAVPLAAHAIVAGVSVCVVCVLRTNITIKLESEDASSFHQGFQRVLRGACDGGVVLHHHTCHILEDATSLEQLLNAGRSLVGTNFLDLLLDTDSRQSFLHFLHECESRDPAAVPPGFKVCLQGADGPVSVDVFCTTCAAAGHLYYLLALKEEPNQFRAPPEAVLESHFTPATPATPPTPPAPASTEKPHVAPSERSRHSEVVSAFKELVQVAMLVNSESPMLDIEEVTFSFLRTKSHGMPTFRQFMKVNDWERLQEVLTSLCSSEADDPSLTLPGLSLRIPGRSKSYVRAGAVTVSLAEEEEFQEPQEPREPGPPGHPSFWVHLSCFNTKARSRQEQDLESIGEESA